MMLKWADVTPSFAQEQAAIAPMATIKAGHQRYHRAQAHPSHRDHLPARDGSIHVGDEAASARCAQVNDDLSARVVRLHPASSPRSVSFPSSDVPIEQSIAELCCISKLGFIGCDLNPGPSGGHWTSPP